MSDQYGGNGLFQIGDFTLASGRKARWKIECDAITDDGWEALAVMLIERLPVAFDVVVGVPRGGTPLAKALLKYASGDAHCTLVVDDVWTTGDSMRGFTALYLGHGQRFHRAVIFAREIVPTGVTALFQMPAHLGRKETI